MASEIEVVEEDDRRDASHTGVNIAVAVLSSSAATSTDAEEETQKNDVYTASAYGDFEKLQRLVESEGCSVTEPDGGGYYALQWAALNNRTAAAQYIIEHGGDVNALDYTGQAALHWSAVRGHIPVAELLLKEGARVDIADHYGYQTTHVAAQYGQTAFLYHIVTKWNADPDVPDKDGRSPLHWAAYKGFADTIRLLLFLDAYRGRQDKEGCTPLHWAAIKGNLEASTVLVQDGKKEDLMVTDNTGSTPAQLAADKNHRQVAFFLGNARKLFDRRCDGNNYFGRLSKLGLAPMLWCIIISLLITYVNSVVTGATFSRLTAAFGLVAWLGVILASSGLFMFYKCSRKDPGYIKRNVRDSQNLRDDVISWKDQKQYWAQNDKQYRFVPASEFAEAFQSFHVGERIKKEITIPFDKTKRHPLSLATSKYGVKRMELLKACIVRELLLLKKNSFVYAFRALKVTIVAIITMTVFFRTNMPRKSVDDGTIFLGSIFFSIMNLMLNGLSEVALTIVTLSIFYKQRDSLFYPSWAYAISAWILKIPLSFVEVSSWVFLTYYVIGYDPSILRFLKHYILIFLVTQWASGLYRSVTVIARTMVLAIATTIYISRRSNVIYLMQWAQFLLQFYSWE